MLSCTGKRSHRHTILHVSFSNSFGLASARPTPQGLSGAPEKAALFCSILTDLAKVQDYNKAKLLMKEFVNDYVDEFYQDGAVNFKDNRYKECKDFCISFKKNTTQDIWRFLNSEGMQSEEYSQFQMMALSGLQAAEDERN